MEANRETTGSGRKIKKGAENTIRPTASGTNKKQSFVETAKLSHNNGDEGDSYSKLLRAHQNLLNENRELRDALIGLRQKLLSISQTADVAANDTTLDSLIRGPTSVSRNHDEIRDSDTSSESQAAGICLPNDGANMTEEKSTEVTGMPSEEHEFLGSLHQWNVGQAIRTPNLAPIIHGLCEQRSSTPFDDSLLFLNDDQRPFLSPISSIGAVSQELGDFGLLESPTLFAEHAEVIKSKVVLANKVEAACKCYISQISMDRRAFEFNITSNNDPSSQKPTVRQVSSAALHLLAASSGLTPYIYGSDFHNYMEAIWQWRLLRTVESRTVIPEPFRPTLLQCISRDHPIIIDLVTWSSIRDQIIRNQAALDLDALTRDLTLHTVIEVPEEGVAVSVYDYTLATMPPASEQVFQVNSMNSCFDDPEWTYIRVPLNPPLSFGMDPVEAVILANLADQMQDLSLKHPPQVPMPSSLSETRTYSFSSLPILDTRINQLNNWKLSKQFPKKWPILDCSAGTVCFTSNRAKAQRVAYIPIVLSAYDTVPCTKPTSSSR